ncbi:hypothetical protein AMTR_s00050p00128870, partial [Amborella trichopoda]
RGTHLSKKGLSIEGTSPPPPPPKRARVDVCAISTPTPVASVSAPRAESETAVAQPERSSLTSFSLRSESEGLPSELEVVATPPVDSPVGSLACSSLSPRDFLTTFA